ncbi:triacylglycerol esterase/lipase EstA (alpha/beta hydrolase family) [Streptomyces sp. V1I6]|nr:triacylglycerol esterase/lipase EstA (alpha/beta hydrolase family) [Streptomyces sp. V1I6]
MPPPDLLTLIDKLREKSGATHVHLVAHSMGGLICRCLLQKVLPDAGRDPADCVDKVFTYGSPHGGITFDAGFGLFEKVVMRQASTVPRCSGRSACTST